MATKQVHATGLKVGGCVIFDGVACKISNIQVSRPGKHGHAKCRIEAVGLVDGRKTIKVVPGHDNVEVPIIEKKTAQVLSVHGDSANVMDMESYETFDIKIPSELKDQVVEGAQVLYWIIMNDKVMKQVK
jgi:translation initiation factor 5A